MLASLSVFPENSYRKKPVIPESFLNIHGQKKKKGKEKAIS